MNWELLDKDILYKLYENNEILPFLRKLRKTEFQSLISIYEWDESILYRLSIQPEHFDVLHKIWDIIEDKNTFIKYWIYMYDNPASLKVNVLDACSYGQLESKKWLVDQLDYMNLDLGNIWILGGWIGTLAYLMFEKSSLIFNKIRSFDLDPNCTILAEILNNIYVSKNWNFKATTFDVNELAYEDFKYITYKDDGSSQLLVETADTIINTSVDHMGSNNTWWENIPNGKLVILQNNDFVDIHDHDNIVHSIEEFAVKYTMSELMYAGKLDCNLYNRYMLIGRK